ncbi:MAG: hypothetical protein KKH72_15485 [Alphaproteobacteria bacterium]|nr:hypothetical protein [Alphaproteobacteria bacterium]
MTFVQETLQALRGIGAILVGRRDAYRHFDLSLAGLAGSMAAFFIALLINGYMPFLINASEDMGPAWQNIVLALLLFGLQVGFAALVLRQFGRMDGLVPYLVADNWATLFMTILSLALALLNIQSDILVLPLGILILIVEINIARLIVTLSGWQIAAFLIAQFAAVVVGLMAFGTLFPGAAVVVTG